jgi:hypothetical protein
VCVCVCTGRSGQEEGPSLPQVGHTHNGVSGVIEGLQWRCYGVAIALQLRCSGVAVGVAMVLQW